VGSDNRGSKMTDVRRRAALVVDNGDFVTLAPEREHGPNEVLSGRPEEPGASNDPRTLPGSRFAVELRPAVRRQRIRRVGLEVRRALRSVKNVISRERHERRAERGGVLRSTDVDRRGVLRTRLRAVDIRPGRGVQHEIDVTEIRRRERDVPVGSSQRASSRKRLV